jgi:hypothetical protein
MPAGDEGVAIATLDLGTQQRSSVDSMLILSATTHIAPNFASCCDHLVQVLRLSTGPPKAQNVGGACCGWKFHVQRNPTHSW